MVVVRRKETKGVERGVMLVGMREKGGREVADDGPAANSSHRLIFRRSV